MMAKELTCEILKEYGEIELDDSYSIKIVEVKWGGRQPKGYDIRKYSKEDERLGKGISIPYESVDDLVKILIDNGLCNIENIESHISERKDKYFTFEDFNDMFNNMNDEMIKYKRDKYGLLRDHKGRVVITSRRRKRKKG